MKFSSLIINGALIAALCAPVMAQAEDNEPHYMRSSIYAVLVKSDKQDKTIKEQNEQAGENDLIGLAQSFSKNNAKQKEADANVDLTKMPQEEFLKLAIPDNFNDHNLAIRVIDFDAIRAGLSQDDIAKYSPKKSGGAKLGGLAKGIAGAAMSSTGSGQSAILGNGNEDVDEAMNAVVNTFFNANNTAAHLVGKWYGYDASAPHTYSLRDEMGQETAAPNWKWTLDNLTYRFNQSMSAEDAEKAKANSNYRTILESKAENMLDNTFVVAINFRFRSNKAIVAEVEQMAQAASKLAGGGMIGNLATKAAGAGLAAALGDGFSVEAVSNLYKLNWNTELANRFYGEIADQNKSIEDLVALGICTLEPVGKAEKARASVRQSKFSDKPISSLVGRATARAYDAALAKLQEKNEVFRIITPISKVDEKGNVYAKIGLKEGISKGDVYEILEPREDANGRVTYKSVGKVKAVDKQIMNNLYGAADEAAENKANAEAKADADADAATALEYTTFEGGKKGQDYSGYYLRLLKKK